MRANAGEAANALSARLGEPHGSGARDAVDNLVEHLRMILDETIYVTTPPVPRSCALVELLLAVEKSEVEDLPWKRLLTRAHPACAVGSRLDGPVKTVAKADLTLWMTERGTPPAVILHDQSMPAQVVMALASSKNGFVARQVAIQVERLLREAASAKSQVKLLWALLMRDPPGEVFEQLATILRGAETPLHQVARELARFDSVREGVSRPGAAESARTLTECYVALAQTVTAILDDSAGLGTHSDAEISGRREGSALLSCFAKAARTLSTLDPRSVGSDPWLQDFETFALGSAGGTGLVGWLQWIGVDVPSCEPEWNRLKRAVRSARDAQPIVPPEMIDELGHAATDLRRAFQAPKWPEAVLLDQHLANLATWREGLARRAAAIRDQAAILDRLLDQRDERKILELIESDVDPSDLPHVALQGLHAFLLDSSSLHGHAETLRKRLRSPGSSGREHGEPHPVLPALHVAFLNRLLDQRDEARIIALVRSDADLPSIHPEVLLRLHAFLLDSLLLADAERLRRRLLLSQGGRANTGSGVVNLPTLPGYLAPFVAAIASGTFLDLEIGKAWNEVLEQGLSLRYWTTIGLALLGSFTLLAATLGWRLNPSMDARRSRIRRVIQVSWRALPAFVGALLVAAVVSGVVLWTLEGTHARRLPDGHAIPFLPHLFLVVSLSLFLGLFLSLVLHRISETSK
jgi:hypothetical protein